MHPNSPRSIRGLWPLIFWFFATSAATYWSVVHFHWPALADGEWIPVSVDSFYHARRILDAVAGHLEFFHFDPLMHAPEGSWVVWSWGYDLFMALQVNVAMALGLAPSPEAALVFLPPLWLYVNTGLILVIARQLGLTPVLQMAALLFPLASVATLSLHGVGVVDHHFMELTCVLGILALAIAWAKEPTSTYRAGLLGAAMGGALAVHHGLFVLQVPVGLWLFVEWLRGRPLPSPAVASFGMGLWLLTLAICLGSPPFRFGDFSAYYLSWFHLYAASAVGLTLAIMHRGTASLRTLAGLALVAGLLVALMAGQVRSGMEFVAGQTLLLDQVDETVGVLQKLRMGQGVRLIKSLTLLMPLAPLFLLWLAWDSRRDSMRTALLTFALFGVAMCFIQVRFFYLALPGLLFPALLAAQAWIIAPGTAGDRRFRTAAAAMMVGLCYLPGIGALPTTAVAGSDHYNTVRPLLKLLKYACPQEPGVVLADYEMGHFIRYHTACGVISNSMMLTPLQQAKILESERLLDRGAEYIRDRQPRVRYILARRFSVDGQTRARRLLLDSNAFPPGVVLLGETMMAGDRGPVPYARLFRIDR